MLSFSFRYIAVVLSNTISVESAGTEIVEAIGNAVPPSAAALYLLIVMSAAFVPSMLATISALILNILPLAAALLTIDVALVVDNDTLALLP